MKVNDKQLLLLVLGSVFSLRLNMGKREDNVRCMKEAVSRGFFVRERGMKNVAFSATAISLAAQVRDILEEKFPQEDFRLLLMLLSGVEPLELCILKAEDMMSIERGCTSGYLKRSSVKNPIGFGKGTYLHSKCTPEGAELDSQVEEALVAQGIFDIGGKGKIYSSSSSISRAQERVVA